MGTACLSARRFWRPSKSPGKVNNTRDVLMRLEESLKGTISVSLLELFAKVKEINKKLLLLLENEFL